VNVNVNVNVKVNVNVDTFVCFFVYNFLCVNIVAPFRQRFLFRSLQTG